MNKYVWIVSMLIEVIQGCSGNAWYTFFDIDNICQNDPALPCSVRWTVSVRTFKASRNHIKLI